LYRIAHTESHGPSDLSQKKPTREITVWTSMVAIMPLKILNCREQAISRFDLVIERNGDVTTANEQYAFLVEDLEAR